ncbi:MAG: hypothetical protein JWN91_2155 [Nocardioides sp.]|nr:hypothetical protein [Nocardioides sp.]
MDWLSIAALADNASYARGEDYARRGLVEISALTNDSLTALARGTSTYDVMLTADSAQCTCPIGLRGDVCKHIVAAALIASAAVEPDAPGAADSGEDPASAIADWLAGLGREAAADAIRELGLRHPDAVEALQRQAARAGGDITAYASLVDSLKTRRFLDYRDANEHGRHAHEVVDELGEALTPGTADALLPLLETGIRQLARVILRSDDSSGIQGDAARRLIDLHAKAAAFGQPDPTKLARWLVRMGVDEQDFWELDVVRYRNALGERGLATYRKELDKRLAKDPTPFMATRGLQRLAVLGGDVDEIVRLVGGDLAGPHAYLSLVDALLEAGHPDQALDFARAGLEARLVPHQTASLYDVTVRMLRERGDGEEVLRLRREQLRRIPNETSYSLLRKAAEQLGTWPTERLGALDVLLEHNQRSWLAALLADGDVALAWEASRDLEIDTSMELALVRARATTHPADVFDAYVALVDKTLETTGDRSYRHAVALLGELRRAAQAAGLDDRYADVVRRLLEEHRRRPTLVKMLLKLPS